MAGVPPLDVAHPVADQFCVPARFQYTVLGVEKVMFVLPPQSPPLLVAVIALVAAVMSRMSTLLNVVGLARVSVRGVPSVSERKKTRRTWVAPDADSVPLMIWSALKTAVCTVLMPGAVNVRLLKVFAPLIVTVVFDAPAPVKATL